MTSGSTARGFFTSVCARSFPAPDVDVEVGHLLVERRAGQAERLRGAGLDAPRAPQRRLDLGALERVDLAGQRRSRRRPRGSRGVSSSDADTSSALIGPVAPGARSTSARSSTLPSSRTLPGQRQPRSASSASSAMPGVAPPQRRAVRASSARASGSTSSGRSRSGGILMRITASR
jgi:hypothetical protein